MAIQRNALIGTLVLLLPIACMSGETKRHYVTDDGKTFSGDVIPISQEQIERSKSAKESLPASEDPEGHWGPIVEGFRLSIRLNKDTFTNSEPVEAVMLLRNVSDQHLRYPVFSSRDSEGTVLLWRGSQRIPGKEEAQSSASLEERLRATRRGSIADWPSPVGTQRRFLVNLSHSFQLTTNGQYSIQACRKVPKLDGSGWTNIVSAKTSFTILDSAFPP